MEVREYISRLTLSGVLREGKESNGWYITACPIHSEGKEQHPSFGILLQAEYRNGQTYPAGFCHCFACGYANTIDELLKEIRRTYQLTDGQKTVINEILKDITDNPDFLSKLQAIMEVYKKKREQEKFIAHKLLLTKPKYISEEELAGYRYTVPYMYERKLTDEIIAKYDVGYDPNFIFPGRKKPTPCITFPVRDEYHRTLFLCRRSIKGKLYNYPEGVQKPVYGIDMLNPKASYILIVESCINALTAETWGYNAVALLGTGNPYQMSQLARLPYRNYVLCFDGDPAGEKGRKRAYYALKDSGIVSYINMPAGKDVNDCEKEEFDELFEDRQFFKPSFR